MFSVCWIRLQLRHVWHRQQSKQQALQLQPGLSCKQQAAP